MKKKPKNLRQVNALTIIIFVCAIFWLMPLSLDNRYWRAKPQLRQRWRGFLIQAVIVTKI